MNSMQFKNIALTVGASCSPEIKLRLNEKARRELAQNLSAEMWRLDARPVHSLSNGFRVLFDGVNRLYSIPYTYLDPQPPFIHWAGAPTGWCVRRDGNVDVRVTVNSRHNPTGTVTMSAIASYRQNVTCARCLAYHVKRGRDA